MASLQMSLPPPQQFIMKIFKCTGKEKNFTVNTCVPLDSAVNVVPSLYRFPLTAAVRRSGCEVENSEKFHVPAKVKPQLSHERVSVKIGAF